MSITFLLDKIIYNLYEISILLPYQTISNTLYLTIVLPDHAILCCTVTKTYYNKIHVNVSNNSMLYKDNELVNKNLLSLDIDRVKIWFDPTPVNFMINLSSKHKVNNMTLQLYNSYNNSYSVIIDNLNEILYYAENKSNINGCDVFAYNLYNITRRSTCVYRFLSKITLQYYDI